MKNIIWNTLEHNCIITANEYIPHGMSVKYLQKEYKLNPIAEEMLSLLQPKLELLKTDKIFYDNFKKSIVGYLPVELRKVDLNKLKYKFPDFIPTFDKDKKKET